MSEFDNERAEYKTDPSEIEKIQSEIDKNLGVHDPAVMSLETTEPEPFEPASAPHTPWEFKAVHELPEDNGVTEIVIEEDVKKGRKKGCFKRAIAIACIVSILGGSFIGLGIGFAIPLAQHYFLPEKASVNETPFQFETQQPGTVVSYVPTTAGYADLVAQVESAVVCIISTYQSQSSYPFSSGSSSGRGSGVIFRETEDMIYILTNSHVTAQATGVQISIGGSSPVDAQPLNKNTNEDLSIITVLKSDLKTAGIENYSIAKFGDSDNMRVGDIVLAIGNSMGEGNSVTDGLISAVEKEITTGGASDRGTRLRVIQTNAAINPGNSGGPLINLNGEVIGITVAKMSETYSVDGSVGYVEGMGYAIPSKIAMSVVEDMMNPKPRLGVSISTMSETLAAQYNLPAAGVLVQDVVPGSGADKAGIKYGDIITGFNGNPVLSTEDLIGMVDECKVGDVVEVKIIREFKDMITVKVTLSILNTNEF